MELNKASEMVSELPEDEDGFICSVRGMNQSFRRKDFAAFMEGLRHSIRVAPRMVELSDQLRRGADARGG
jgi:hypothetical protein